MRPSRRAAVARILSATASLLGSDSVSAQQPCDDGAAAGTLIETLPLSREDGVVQPFAVKFGGAGLDARQVTDLSRLEPGRLVTPNDLAFIRTERPRAAVQRPAPWSIATTGLLADEGTMTVAGLARRARPMGIHLLECSGNNNPANFGLMSAAAWEGVPLAAVVSGLKPAAQATGVLVAGLDDEGQPSSTSVAGAGWVLPLEGLDRLGAFLAMRMNGAALPPDHGQPVRLVVPGWYGCAWIKWVDTIRLVGAEEPATGQMKEFAGRTHQEARHDLARDYRPPAIQAAAMPIRVEKRRAGGRVYYRVVGVAWGGDPPADRLEIRFAAGGAWTPVSMCRARSGAGPWSLWEYRWTPPGAGVYAIALRVPDASVPQRRLDSGYYVRQVRIQVL